MALDLTGAHAPGVHGNDLIIKIIDAALALRDDHRFEFAVSVTGNIDLNLPELALDLLGVLAISGIAGVLTGRRPLGVPFRSGSSLPGEPSLKAASSDP